MPSRRRFLRAVAGSTGLAVAGSLAGCGLFGPDAESVRAVAPAHGGGYVAVGTTEVSPAETGVVNTWAASVAPDGTHRWTRVYRTERWPGDNYLGAVCRLGDGYLLGGKNRNWDEHDDEADVEPGVRFARVDDRGDPTWHRTDPERRYVYRLLASDEGAIAVAGSQFGDGPHSTWVGRIAPDGTAEWPVEVPGRYPETVRRTADGTLTVGGRVLRNRDDDEYDEDVPWLAAVGPDDTLRWDRVYDRDALVNARVEGVVPTDTGYLALAGTRLLALDSDGRLQSIHRQPAVVDSETPTPTDAGATPNAATFALGRFGSERAPTLLVDTPAGVRLGVLDGPATVARTLTVRTDADPDSVRSRPDGSVVIAGADERAETGRDAWLARVAPGRGLDWQLTFPQPTEPET